MGSTCHWGESETPRAVSASPATRTASVRDRVIGGTGDRGGAVPINSAAAPSPVAVQATRNDRPATGMIAGVESVAGTMKGGGTEASGEVESLEQGILVM